VSTKRTGSAWRIVASIAGLFLVGHRSEGGLPLKTKKTLTSLFLVPFALSVVWQMGFAQEPNPISSAPNPAPAQNVEQVNQPDHVPLYHVRVVGRNLDAVNYFRRSGSTKIALRGTDLLPMAHDEARVKRTL